MSGSMNGKMLGIVAAILSGSVGNLPKVRRIRRGETAGQTKRSAPAHIIAQRIEKAKAKRERKAARRKELAS